MMKNTRQTLFEREKTLKEFDRFERALIDASSLIYLSKAGLLPQLLETLTLLTLAEIAAEVGDSPLAGITIVAHEFAALTNDQKLIQTALAARLPVISEDKQILKQIARAGLPYYNALMMLNRQLYLKLMSDAEYASAYALLRRIARYSEAVWEYGEQIHAEIISRRSI